MFKSLIKGLLAGLAVKLLDNYQRLSLQLLKIEAAKCYLQVIALARLLAFDLMRMALATGLICFGILLLHAGFFILLPWSIVTKAFVGIVLGLVYLISGAMILRSALNEKNWMEQFGASEILKDTTSQPKSD